MAAGAVMPLAIMLGAAAAGFAVLWAWCHARRDATPVDVAWAAAIGLGSLAMLAGGDGDPLRRVLLAAVIGAWSLRLALHLALTRLGHGEDGRYRKLRAEGKGAGWFFIFFQGQALAATLFTVPAWAGAGHDAPLAWWNWLGAAIALAGIAYEGVADAQLHAFKRDPTNRGQLCRRGLWAWSRHPNYFGEICCWCGVAMAACAADAWPWPALVPVVLTLLIWKVTGIPATESHTAASRGAAWAAYARDVPALIPRKPRNTP